MKILCAVDGSEVSEEAVKVVAEHPWPADTIVRILSVAEKVHPSAVELVATGKSPEDAQHALDLRRDVVATSAAAKLGAAGIKTESTTREGNPKTIIVEEARDWGAELIVVGHKGRSGLSRIVLGSVAEHVVAHAHCSVLVVRHDAVSKP
jgi:nucleotide-binding universal stress UspA family protein